jgi:hypothetical protein
MDRRSRRTEITTRRLIVADSDDRPRIVAEVVNEVAELRVSTLDPATYVLMYAGPVSVGGPDGIGVDLFVHGDSVARLQAWADGDRWRWQLTAEE